MAWDSDKVSADLSVDVGFVVARADVERVSGEGGWRMRGTGSGRSREQGRRPSGGGRALRSLTETWWYRGERRTGGVDITCVDWGRVRGLGAL